MLANCHCANSYHKCSIIIRAGQTFYLWQGNSIDVQSSFFFFFLGGGGGGAHWVFQIPVVRFKNMIENFEKKKIHLCHTCVFVFHDLTVLANRYAAGNHSKTPVGNPSYGIYSALGYTVLFTHLAALVLDIPLPRKCIFRYTLTQWIL